MKRKVKLGVLVSGSGSNLQSVIDHIEKGLLDAEIRMIISNTPEAYALVRARTHGIPYTVLEHRDFDTREAFDRKMIEVLNQSGVELVILAGFMRILSPLFLAAFPMRIMNIHPAILPSFPGMHAQKRAFDYGVKFSGCTVHFVSAEVDMGAIVLQAVVPVLQNDTAETLAARILVEEHKIYPEAARLYFEGRLEIRGRRVTIL